MMNSLSISGKQWIYKKFDSSYVNFLKENYFLDEITARLLSIRNIDKKYIDSFLKPSIKNLVPNPNCLRDMDKASQRILKAINRKEKIGIFGDYDVDGSTSVAMIVKYFQSLGVSIHFHITNRFTEGYGHNKELFKKISQWLLLC